MQLFVASGFNSLFLSHSRAHTHTHELCVREMSVM